MSDWVGNRNSVYKMLGASNHTDKEREKDDYYATDPIAIDKLLTVERPNENVWECACVDKANYNEEIGARCCMERIERKLWELEGYALQKELAECDKECEDVREKTAKERVEEDKAEVIARAQKLAQFLQSKSSDKLNDGERYLLQLQLQKMCEYADILAARLGVWREI